MANTYFKFKQFTINQDNCAMKVCTDACLFGAIIANQNSQVTNCLDIGAGTGLLSLMFAQKNSAAKIDAVELDAAAALQAVENIAASPWAANIQVYDKDILTFAPHPQDAVHKKYDCIFSNPPFFEDDLKSADETKNNAKHDTSLSLVNLLQVVDNLLSPNGFFVVLLPYHRVEYFIEEAKRSGLHLNKQILVKQTIKHTFFRGILFFSRTASETEQNEIIIKNSNQQYTSEFSAALKDYYLFL